MSSHFCRSPGILRGATPDPDAAASFDDAKVLDVLARLKASRADGVWLAASLIYRGDDRRRLAQLDDLAVTAKVPLLATNEVLYHHPARRPLQDVLTCIREKTTIEAVGRKLEANAERFLKTPREMARLFRDFPEAIAETMRFADKSTSRSISSNTSIRMSRCHRARPRRAIWRT